jgi:hypothetical protein
MADEDLKGEAVAKVLYAIAGLRDIEASLMDCECPPAAGRMAWLSREHQKKVLEMLANDNRMLTNVGLPSEKFAACFDLIANGHPDATEFEAFLAATRDVRERYERCLRLGENSSGRG